MSLSWLVTGGSGQLGGSVSQLLKAAGRKAFSPSRSELDICDRQSIRTVLHSVQPAGVINCAAYTAVDLAESEAELAFLVNALAPQMIAEECAALGIPLVHISTDYVFAGNKTQPYVEEDPTGPLGVYGASKEAGERAVRQSGAQHAIVRTAWLLNSTGSNFLTTMLRLGTERKELKIVSDQMGCPTSIPEVAVALIAIADELGPKSGTWHLVNQGSASWYELAVHIFGHMKRRHSATPVLLPISAADYPVRTPRPANSILATGKIETDFGIRLSHWQKAVDDILEDIFSESDRRI